ncbi:hypothetical protein RJ639_022000 [Escallonia herrerae]|uniref:Uncharacterized protein n=1 Tax=Escallonia herrerae TaxID=1293975 RepID=A0AA88V3U9_9ASTE|nr:hypothetical protein RJ639_022000 [Escallonia herrerae]
MVSLGTIGYIKCVSDLLYPSRHILHAFNGREIRVSRIESKSSHQLAAALVVYAHSHSLEPTPKQVEEFQCLPGEGIYGEIGEASLLGTGKLLQ